jgi:hypothetical protein
VRIRFADGTSTSLTPARGYVLWAASAQQLLPAKAAVGAEGLRKDGTVAARVSFPSP